ncbi:hypothetical protein JDV02_010117 [Purpureocillium takamizusanense]|uniref:Uncharacterized protein n=1 Tax=Purpureocillium takamizusanense TaxID=2060973 RepID=A0A9Q8VEW7_9HYPO|nr:uncharacterized protein JDV02_010117 [Purpureocillium takamizusanense]UNI24365.1 hypothetical protein JDV02_010117 [Purpureocillium takamizusanense]
MPPTPIHVRGKRKALSDKAPKGLPGPPPKMRKSLGIVLASRATRAGATLESLPYEILESILLYSTNLSLPRASPIVGMKLSSRATLLRLFIWAFHETWEQSFGIPARQRLFHVGQMDGEKRPPFQGDHTLQSALLEQPWAKIDFILQAQQAWADRYARHRWYQHSLPRQESFNPIDHDHEGGFAHFNARECFEVDYQQARQWPAFFATSLQWRGQDVHPWTRMPMDLVSGPWDDEQLRRLFWLSRGGLKIGDQDQQRMPPWEVKLQCLDNAALSAPVPNSLVINCLMQDWIFTDLPDDVVRKQRVSLDRRIDWGADSPENKQTLRQIRIALVSLSEHEYTMPR